MPARNRFQYLIPEPMDFEALMASRKRPTQRGDRRPRAEVDKLVASRKRNLAIKRQEKSIANRKPKKAKVGIPLKVRIAKLFQPKLFYALPDLIRLAKSATPLIPVGSVKARATTMAREGDLERVRNPEWRVMEDPFVKGRQPEWLYRLTEQGEALRLL